MEYAFAVWDDQLVLGLREEGRFDRIVDLETCGLMSRDSVEVVKRVRQWAKDQGLQDITAAVTKVTCATS